MSVVLVLVKNDVTLGHQMFCNIKRIALQWNLFWHAGNIKLEKMCLLVSPYLAVRPHANIREPKKVFYQILVFHCHWSLILRSV